MAETYNRVFNSCPLSDAQFVVVAKRLNDFHLPFRYNRNASDDNALAIFYVMWINITYVFLVKNHVLPPFY